MLGLEHRALTYTIKSSLFFLSHVPLYAISLYIYIESNKHENKAYVETTILLLFLFSNDLQKVQ